MSAIIDKLFKAREQELIAEFIKKMEFIELYSKNPKLMAREYKIEYQKETSRG